MSLGRIIDHASQNTPTTLQESYLLQIKTRQTGNVSGSD